MKNFHPALVLPFALVSMTALRGCVVFISYFPSGTKISVWWDKYTCTYAQLHEMHTFYTKNHTHTHKQPGSVGAQFHSSVYGLPQRRNWSGIIVSSSSVLYDVDLRAEAQRVGWLGVKDQNGLMSLLFEELTEQRSNRLEIKVCSPGGWLDNMFEMGFFPLSRYTVVPDKVEETKDAFNDRMIETVPRAPYFMPLFLKCLRKCSRCWRLFTIDNDFSFQLR